MITYCTCSGATPERSSAALMATPPRSAAEKSLSEPSSLPIGVRAPLTITEPAMATTFRLSRDSIHGAPILGCEQAHASLAVSAAQAPPWRDVAANRPRGHRGARPRRGDRVL